MTNSREINNKAELKGIIENFENKINNISGILESEKGDYIKYFHSKIATKEITAEKEINEISELIFKVA